MKLRTVCAAAAFACVGGWVQAGPVVTGSVDALTLANTIGGVGITISNPTLTYAGAATLPLPSGTFTGGGTTVGFSEGIVLTNGTIGCVPGPNNASGCGLDRSFVADNSGVFDRTTLAFDFSSDTGKVFFRYVFGSEEYTQFVDSEFNDAFQLLLNGVNIAQLPGGGGEVSINNVNCGSNSAYYRNNVDTDNGDEDNNTCATLGLDIQYDGLTTILTASADVIAGASNRFEFTIFDRGDSALDSAVFIEKGSFSGEDPNPMPEPGSLLLAAVALAGAGALRRRSA
ncbi:MAG TPA: choice-of-anchor L domain-containing protein [Rubrivivax sp.]|jgi:MYXO-CTERM domain-containing protein|nr:choice-of-anchor L domain-containing protein [Rubrivivax sp.]